MTCRGAGSTRGPRILRAALAEDVLAVINEVGRVRTYASQVPYELLIRGDEFPGALGDEERSPAAARRVGRP